MDLLFTIFITLILLVVFITGGREKKKIKELKNQVSYDTNIIIDCNISKEGIDTIDRNK